jgi:hypothetical protein
MHSHNSSGKYEHAAAAIVAMQGNNQFFCFYVLDQNFIDLSWTKDAYIDFL